ncbi:LysR family transcriptional regulator [Pseudoroseicyclus tamaricis]|uniref:LysR family transcriptional regulator n=1 Tax=Pseudoroseicyclus tamaricis TaxID=2705421 RepID=A0A6B2JTL8_9RHOB|nr:LysR family transcriptional regulator [Pseudoroseicyclus tamaricis]NDV01897.1 LysR family transcriptional regulator [Pseudoroseicyclus tamaricis]
MLDRLELFLILARTRHFGRAAEEAGITQPSLSAAIRQLEAQLGCVLVNRGSRFQGLTPEGERVLDWARRLTGDVRAMKAELRAAREGLTGRLRLAVIPTALTTAARLSAAIASRHPGLRLTVTSASSIEILERLDDLTLDVGLTYLDNEPLGRARTLPLYAERYVLVTRTDDAPAGPELPWAELAALNLCLLTPEMQNRRIIDGYLSEAGVTVTPQVETNSTITLISHVIAGGWATILPSRAAEPFLATGPLTATPLTAPDAHHAVGLVYPPREPVPPLLKAFLAEARGFAE